MDKNNRKEAEGQKKSKCQLLISKNGLITKVLRTIKKCENAKVKVVYACIRLLYLMDW